MLTIHSDIIFNFLHFLTLKEQGILASTCNAFNKMTNQPENLKSRIKPEDLKLANVNFFKKFFFLFEVDHIRQFNYRLITRIELNDITFFYQNDQELNKIRLVAKFLHSLQNASFSAVACFNENLEKPPSWQTKGAGARGRQENVELFCDQIPYQHLFADSRQNFQFLRMLYKKSQGAVLKEEIEQDIQVRLGQKYEDFITQFAIQARQISNLVKPITDNTFLHNLCSTLLHLIDDPRLQLTDPKLLEDLYTGFWQQYSIKHLNNQKNQETPSFLSYTYMPLQMFKGLCNHIKLTPGNFGSFQKWLLTEEHLQAWNAAFENRQVESLKVGLVYEITPHTFKKFSQIVLNFTPQTQVQISYRIPRGQIQHKTTQLFIAFQDVMLLKNPDWSWAMEEEELTL